ncbi:MAG TPA: DUF2282 domain-containing protein [Candidatus Cybelea sp.]|nr:DUF2282 domain-containing protein [Candidatus Cybelea sp.]
MTTPIGVSAAIAAAIGLAAMLQGCTSSSTTTADNTPAPVKATMAKLAAGGVEKCFGVNAVGKNDCAEGAHACAGMATKAMDPQSFILVPSGACSKIDGGHTSAT